MERGKIEINFNESGKISMVIELVNGTVWLTQCEIADLFAVYRQKVGSNIKSLFRNREVLESETMCYHNKVYYYNLDMIIALAFKMEGGYCRLFREWVSKQVKLSFTESQQQPIIINLGNGIYLNN